MIITKPITESVNHSITDFTPEQLLLHGPSKRYVNDFVWFDPKVGAAAVYHPTAKNVEDHFGLFRGVDQVESFAQGVAVAPITLMETLKGNRSLKETMANWSVVFVGIGEVKLHNVVKEGDLLISIGKFDFYRFRKLVVSGKTYKAAPDFDARSFFKNYSEEKMESAMREGTIKIVGEISDLTVQAINNQIIN